MGALNDLQNIYQSSNPNISGANESARDHNFRDSVNKFDQWKAENEAAKQNAYLSSAYEQSNWENRFNSENERQNWLLQNQKAVEVSALRQAGLNPALAGGGVSPAAINNPSAGTPTATAPHFNPALSGQEMMLRGLEGAKGIAAEFTQWAKLPNEAKSAKSVAEFDKWHAALEKKQVGWFDRTAEANVGMTNAQASQYLQQARWLDADTYVKFNKLPAEMKVLGATAAQLASQAGLNDQKAKESIKYMELIDKQLDLTEAQKKELYARMATYASQIALNKSQANLNNRLGSPAKWLDETLTDIVGNAGKSIGKSIGSLWDKFIGLFN